MSNERQITERTPNVAAQLADRWATAAAAQARRIKHPEDILERVPDCWVQVSVLRQLLRAAQMAERATGPETAQRRIRNAIEAFLEEIVFETAIADRARAFKLARDALEHFDDYHQGSETSSSQERGGATARPARTSRSNTARGWMRPPMAHCACVSDLRARPIQWW